MSKQPTDSFKKLPTPLVSQEAIQIAKLRLLENKVSSLSDTVYAVNKDFTAFQDDTEQDLNTLDNRVLKLTRLVQDQRLSIDSLEMSEVYLVKNIEKLRKSSKKSVIFLTVASVLQSIALIYLALR